MYLLFHILGLKFLPNATPKNNTIATIALNINKNKSQKDEESGDFVNIWSGVIRVIKKLTASRLKSKFFKEWKGHILILLNGFKSFPHLWIK